MSKSMENKTAAMYLRKSTEDGGKSVTAQEHDVRIRAEQLGIEIVAVYREDDGTSASSVTNHDRPQFNRLLDDYRAEKFDTIMVWGLDRLTRKGGDEVGPLFTLLAKHEGRLVDMNMDTDAMGLEVARLPALLLGELGRGEVVRSQERILRGKESQRRQGAWLGGQCPYGLAAVRSFDRPTYLVIDPEAAGHIKDMADWVIEGCSTTEVAHKLNGLGLRTARNAAWNKTTVKRLLRSPHMIGQRVYREIDKETKKIISEDVARDENGNPLIVTDPILDEATFARVDAVLSARKRGHRQTTGKTNGKVQKSLLAGLMNCTNCNGKLIHHQQVKGPRYYHCGICKPDNTAKAEVIENDIAEFALMKLAALEDGNPILDEVGRRWMAQYSAGDMSHRNKLQDEATKIEGRLDKLRQAFYVAGTMTNESKFTDMETDLMGKLAPIEAELATIPETNSDISPLFDLVGCGRDFDAGITGEGSAWAALEHHVRRSILRCVIDTVEVQPGEKGKPGENIPQRCTITLATSENVTEMGNRSNRIQGKHLVHTPKVLASK